MEKLPSSVWRAIPSILLEGVHEHRYTRAPVDSFDCNPSRQSKGALSLS